MKTFYSVNYACFANFIKFLDEKDYSYHIEHNEDNNPITLTIYFERYTMNSIGYFIGYENYELIIDIEEKLPLHNNKIHNKVDIFTKYCFCLDKEYKFVCTNAPETSYNEEETIEDSNDNIMDNNEYCYYLSPIGNDVLLDKMYCYYIVNGLMYDFMKAEISKEETKELRIIRNV